MMEMMAGLDRRERRSDERRELGDIRDGVHKRRVVCSGARMDTTMDDTMTTIDTKALRPPDRFDEMAARVHIDIEAERWKGGSQDRQMAIIADALRAAHARGMEEGKAP